MSFTPFFSTQVKDVLKDLDPKKTSHIPDQIVLGTMAKELKNAISQMNHMVEKLANDTRKSKI